ncbi:mannosyltransferase putative-domain-containing protein [Hyaloraphidium curvatum]|nr:mannosyltransferase putative-domain-containing protein [Hyaloraphidium curvatum]
MPKFPPADQLTGPLPTDPDNPTSPLNPRANEPYAHPEITPRTLDYARRFLRAYEAKLFPFLRPTFSSLSALHKSSRAGGRGIVMSAGDPQLRACMVSIRTIREKMGSRLPIEIWYSGPGDLSDWGASRFKRWGAVTVRDIRHLFDHEVADLGGWAIKPFAVLGSSFREVIFVDADVVFMQPPDNLFHHQLYLDTGALFFRDRHNLFPDSKGHGDWLRSVMPRPPSDTIRQRKMYMGKGQHEMESGVMAIDRWRHLEGLVAAAKLMSKEWREGSGKWALGDKELFWMGFELVADTSYSMHPARSGVLGVLIPRHLPGGATVFRMGKNASYRPDAGWHPTPEDRGKICGIQLAHPTDPLFFAAGPRYGNDPESDSEEGEPGFNFTRPAGNVSRDPLEDKVRTYRSRRKDRLEALRKANETVDPAFRLERIPKEQPVGRLTFVFSICR